MDGPSLRRREIARLLHAVLAPWRLLALADTTAHEPGAISPTLEAYRFRTTSESTTAATTRQRHPGGRC